MDLSSREAFRMSMIVLVFCTFTIHELVRRPPLMCDIRIVLCIPYNRTSILKFALERAGDRAECNTYILQYCYCIHALQKKYLTI